jgi:hypothetical protein
MSHPVVTEVGYTKFNLSYPAMMANATPGDTYPDVTDEVSPPLPFP